MERQTHLRLIHDSLAAYGQIIDHWDRQVQAKGPVGDWPSVDVDRFSRDVVESSRFLREELGRLTDELRRHDLGLSHNDFGDSARAKGIRQLAARLGEQQ